MNAKLFDARSCAITLLIHLLLLVLLWQADRIASPTLQLTIPAAKQEVSSIVQVKAIKKRSARTVKAATSKVASVRTGKQAATKEIAACEHKVATNQGVKDSAPITVSRELPPVWKQQGCDTRKLVRSVHTTIHRSWSPPIGITSQTAAHVTIEVASGGRVRSCVFTKRSGHLLFDQSIRLAQQHWCFEKRLWGQRLMLVLTG